MIQGTLEHSLVVVFGGAGYIGSVLVRKLLERNYRVRIFDNFLFGNYGVRELSSPNLEIIDGDICDTVAVSIALNGADAVIFLAAVVGRRVKDIPLRNVREVNLLASSAALDAAIEHGASRFLFASTDSVYGVQSGVMYETGTPEPISLYSRLKLRMEERILRAEQPGFHPTALRIATCHGYSPRMRFDLVANGLIRDAVCLKEVTIEGGEQCRTLIHVDDVADAFIAVLEAHENLVSGELFNVGVTGSSVQLKQLVGMVKNLVPETKVNFLEGEPDLVDYFLSCKKIEKVLDFTPKWTIEAGLEQVRDLLLEGYFTDPYSAQYANT